MSPSMRNTGACLRSFPRVSGDEPLYVPAVGDPQMFSPRERG